MCLFRLTAIALLLAAAETGSMTGCLGEGDFLPAPEAGSTSAANEGGGPRDGSSEGGKTPDGGARLDGGNLRETGGGPTVAGIRVANLSPDAPPVDFCIALHGTTAFQGPLLAQIAGASVTGASDAGTAGVGFEKMSAYASVSAGQYDMRIVAAGATDCSVGIVDATMVLSLAAGAYGTAALMGEAAPVGNAPGLQIVPLIDEAVQAAVPDGGSAVLLVRFLNAAPTAGAVDFQIDGNKLFAGVSFGQASSATNGAADAGIKVDSSGYWSRAALSGNAVTVVASGAASGPQPLAQGKSSAATGAIITIAVVGTSSGSIDGGPPPLVLLQCVDNAGTVGVFANCGPLSD